MENITFYGGVREIGGNIIDLETDNARLLFDFGKNFGAESDYFSEFLNPRKAHGIEDFLELGLLPDIKGLYRKDYLKHLGKDVQEEPAFDAVFLTHAHMDHIGYVHFLRSDIPIYCTPTTATMMDVVQDTGSYTFDEFVEMKESFHLRRKSRKDELTKFDRDIKSIDRSIYKQRDINTIGNEETVSIGDTEVTCYRVNHSLPGAAGFHIETPQNCIAYTGDLRLHGYQSHHTENFIEASRNFEPDYLITEGTNVGNSEEIPPEEKVREKLQWYIGEENDGVFVNHPRLDLERMRSVVRAAKGNDRQYVVRTWQAHMLKELEENGLLPWDDLSVDSPHIRILAPQKGWGMLMHKFRTPSGEWKRLDEIDIDDSNHDGLVKKDYRSGWERELVMRDDTVTPLDICDNLENYVLYTDYYRLKDLIDLKPERGMYLWSRTEPFNQEMEIEQRRVHNWLNHFNLQMRKAHASGHMSQKEIKEMIEEINPSSLLAIHTEKPDWFRKLTYNQPEIEEGKTIKLASSDISREEKPVQSN
ncbi:MAG: MBL fold metallo-hydrolase [Candidatus Nanohaloarchaea archaeon]